MSVTQTLYNSKIQEKEDGKKAVYSFISCVANDDSTAAVLKGKDGLVRSIAKYAIPVLLSEDECHYKVRIEMCTGTEYVHVEALKNKGGWGHFNIPPGTTPNQVLSNEWSGSFSSQTIHGAASLAIEDWIRATAHETNDDGSFLTEGQLRVHFAAYQRERFCDSRTQCDGKCCALPGDTIYWRYEEPYRVVSRCEPATDAELRERGWLTQGGLLARCCELYREDPSQSDDDGNGNA